MDDTRSQVAYDRIARIAQRLFHTKIVLISFMDGDRQWFKSHLGTTLAESSLDQTFCSQTILTRQMLVVEDALGDPRFIDNTFVRGEMGVRFYAGQPLVTHDGYVIGTVCLIDSSPRVFSEADKQTLADLGEIVMTQVKNDRDLTYRDPATKLPNRLQFSADLKGLDASEKPRSAVVVEIMGLPEANEATRALGLDYFYDHFSYAIECIRSSLDAQTIYHIGPVHLAFVLEAGGDAIVFLKDLERRLRAPFVTPAGIPARLSPGCGVRAIDDGDINAVDVIRTLLQASRDARESRSGVSVYDQAADADLQRAYVLVTEFPRALLNDELFLVYQPRVSTISRVCVSVEALVRWRHPKLGVMPPAAFLPSVVKTALIRDLTDWVMEKVCAQLHSWRVAGLSLRCSFNVGAKNLEEDDFVQRLGARVAHYKLEPGALEVELVEDVSLMRDHATRDRLAAVRRLGVDIAIDDFGTGYGNLSYLLDVPVSTLKLDKSIVQGTLTNSLYATATADVIQMGHHLGYRIVAEGIETEELAQQLASWNCDELQGYRISKPLTAQELIDWVHTNRGS
ncbi:EAL domain-containing protein [Aureimonas altamirensis]|uniref:EAL domain-containing protein n=1 Tax=Aureimonas altamirensis TaxID=370622 RepID=UPI001E485FF0|nr:EAL domain-containing protein [Aureimonas altamirensis]UHD43886.1 EAL domain-containing protein [Aureimonas altamirensis]